MGAVMDQVQKQSIAATAATTSKKSINDFAGKKATSRRINRRPNRRSRNKTPIA